jgi:hypothetical protein
MSVVSVYRARGPHMIGRCATSTRKSQPCLSRLSLVDYNDMADILASAKRFVCRKSISEDSMKVDEITKIA